MTQQNQIHVKDKKTGKLKGSVSLKGKKAPLAATVEFGKIIKVQPDKPFYTPSAIRPLKAELGDVKHILNQLTRLTEPVALKFYQAGVKEEQSVAWSQAHERLFALMEGKRFDRLNALWEKRWPDFNPYFNDVAWMQAWNAGTLAMLALDAREEISSKDYEVLTKTWRKLVGPIHPDEEELRRAA